MSGIPNARSIANAMAANAASYVLITPPDRHDDAIASVAAGFRDACIEHGVPIEAGDMALLREGRHCQSRRDDTPHGRARDEGEGEVMQNRSLLFGVCIGLFGALAVLTARYVAVVLAG
jgi:hypothetical protein